MTDDELEALARLPAWTWDTPVEARAVPRLIAEVRRLRARVAALEGALRRAATGYRNLGELGLLTGEYAEASEAYAREIDAALAAGKG